MRQLTVKELKEYELEEIFPEEYSIKLLEEVETKSNGLKLRLGLRNEPVVIYKRKRKNYIKFSGISGVIKILDYEIEVMPKFCQEGTEWRNNLFNMIYISKSHRISVQPSRHMERNKVGFYDHLALLFIEEMQSALMKETIHTYQTIQENSRFLKGRFLLGEQMKHLVTKPGIVYYEYDVWNCENSYNYLIHWSTEFLLRKVQSLKVKQSLREILDIVPKTKKKYTIPVQGKLPPQYNHYEKIIQISNELATGYSTSHQQNGKDGYGYVVAMEVIYEKFIERILQSLQYNEHYIRIEPQSSVLFAKSQSTTFRSYYTVPDNKVFVDGEPRMLIDAKYKRNLIDGTSKKPVNSDVYQLFSSLVAHKCKIGILISPCESNEHDIIKNHWEIEHEGQSFIIFSLLIDLSDISNLAQIKKLKATLINVIKEILEL